MTLAILTCQPPPAGSYLPLANLKAEINQRRANWFTALEPCRQGWEWTIVRTPAAREEIVAMRSRFETLSFFGLDEEIALVRLVAVVFSVLSTANGHTRNYATRHDNIRAMLNTLLNGVEEIQRYAVLIERLLRHTNQNNLLAGKVGEHIERAKRAMEGSLCLEGEPEWEVMAYLIPEVFDRVTREELVYLGALPAWAVVAAHP